jgi:hypothetical protein
MSNQTVFKACEYRIDESTFHELKKNAAGI